MSNETQKRTTQKYLDNFDGIFKSARKRLAIQSGDVVADDTDEQGRRMEEEGGPCAGPVGKRPAKGDFCR